jgi:hypothetical protein
MRKPTDRYRELAEANEALKKILAEGAAAAIKKIPKEEPEMVQLENITVRKLIKFMEGGWNGAGGPYHYQDGMCPTSVGDPDRDPDCPACQLLVRVEEALKKSNTTGSGSEDVLDNILNGSW